MANNNDIASQWPPASPKDVLRLTPRKAPVNSIHSSPLRNTTIVSPTRGRRHAPVQDDDSDATTSEEDEEALQLQLKAIEMKLKLKRLQKEKKRKAERTTAPADTQSTTSGRVTPPPNFERTAPDVQVPVSPSPRKRNAPLDDANPPPSPSRVLLGIDKGLKARDISLKRAPGMTNLMAEPPRKPEFMSSTSSTASALRNVTKDRPDPFASRAAAAAAAPVKSFSERIAEQRAGITAKETRAKENEKLRSKGWNVESSESSASTTTTANTVTRTESRAVVLSRTSSTSSRPIASQQPTGRLQTQRTNSTTSTSSTSSISKETQPPKPTISNAVPSATTTTDPTPTEQVDSSAGFDSFSSHHLSRRTLGHTQLARHLNEKEIFHLPRLLKSVHSPDYEPPDVPGDWVVMGIVASKSEPRDVAREGAGKYMVIQITDLKWEVDLFFFGTAFQKYYRIAVGTVLAILNPNIMKPRNADSGKFSLTLSDNNDTLLEIGTARDLGACKARKRDGKECGSWVDKRNTEFCDFHVEQAVSKVRSSRPEVMSMSKLYSPPKKGQVRPKRNWLRGGKQEKDDGLLPLKEGMIPDLPVKVGGGGGNVYVTNFSTAKLIDNHDMSGDPSWQREKEERLKRVLARREKEREITKGLLSAGNTNTGMDYLKANLEDEKGKGLALGGARGSTAEAKRQANAMAAVGGGTVAAEAKTAAIEQFRASAAKLTAANVSLSPVKSKRKSADITTRNTDSPSPPPGTGDERAIKRSKGNIGPIGWAQRDVKKHLERNVALTSNGGLRQTQLGFRSRSRSRSPAKRMPPSREGDGDAGGQGGEKLPERPGSPNKSNLKSSGSEKGDVKSVKFAPMPSVEDDDSDDDLEIL
ncbi:hypothetical protein AA313_de0205037 [Arthrobotrys entomopaga]|nr:hypothetical protein AA313_de0205037 [Arthrobotrys entomopaga]